MTILTAIQAIFVALSELFKWLQTPEGQTFSAQMRTDRTAWDKFWSDAGVWFVRFGNGDLFKK